MKENLKPYVYKQIKFVKERYRTFCRTVRRVILYGKVKYLEVRSRSESESERASKSYEIDPKPSDLSMSRLKLE